MMFLSRAVAAGAALTLGLSGVAAAMAADSGGQQGVRDLGRAPRSVRVHVAVMLKYHNAAELDRLVEEQASPKSALYHHFLAPAQFRSYFSPTPAEYGGVVSALVRGGFTITHVFANRSVVDASAPAPIAARFFDTDIHRVLAPGVGLAYTNVTPATVPAEIGLFVQAVAGLDTTIRMHPASGRSPIGTPPPIRPNTRFNGVPLFGPNGGYGPSIFVNAYDLPALSGVTGTGRATGVATDADFLDSDLGKLLSYFGVTRTGPATVRVPVDGGAPPGLSTDSTETTLDVETIVSLAPGTALYVYLAPYSLTNKDFIDIDNTVVNDNLVDTVNESYGYCETKLNYHNPGYSKAVDAIMEQGAAQGITFNSATGDNGAIQPYGCPHKVSVSTPSDVPHNVAIGGTTLQVNQATGQETSEVGWNTVDGASGGGVSVIFPVPTYQQGVPNVIARGRNIPDISFDGGSQSATSLYYNGNFEREYGTSLASPIFSAALTEIDQLQNSRAGYFNVTLYQTWLANGYGNPAAPYLRDITIGNIPPYGAGPGYDQMTGIGAMRAATFATLLPH